jgi:hypothetical protein
MLAWSEIDYGEQYIQVLKRVKQLETEVQEWKNQVSKK